MTFPVCLSDDDENTRTVSVLLDGEESTMLVIDASGEEVGQHLQLLYDFTCV